MIFNNIRVLDGNKFYLKTNVTTNYIFKYQNGLNFNFYYNNNNNKLI
jgi:hypothetical protein